MFKIFNRKSEKQKLEEQYQKLINEAYHLSHINRAKSDQKQAEAEAVLKRIESLQQKES